MVDRDEEVGGQVKDATLERAFFVGLLVVVTLAFIWLVRGFLQPIFWAVALGIVFYPVHTLIEQRVTKRPSLAAGISVMLVLVVVILPIVFLAFAVTDEAAGLYQRLRAGDIDLNQYYAQIQQRIPALVERLNSLGVDLQRIPQQLSSSAVTISQFIASQALSLGQDTVRVTVYFFLMLYLLFFFMRDSRKILEGLVHALPFGDEREMQLLQKFAEVSRATIKGTLVIGIVQGTIGAIAFAFLGIGAPVLWGVVMALLSIIPAVGPAFVWIPAAVILAVNDRYAAAIVLVIVGALIISLVDNLLRPILVGRDTRMPDYLVLLSTLGGLTAFGLAGVVIGPIIAALFLSIWEMASQEFAGLHAARSELSNQDEGASTDEDDDVT